MALGVGICSLARAGQVVQFTLNGEIGLHVIQLSKLGDVFSMNPAFHTRCYWHFWKNIRCFRLSAQATVGRVTALLPIWLPMCLQLYAVVDPCVLPKKLPGIFTDP